MFLTVNFLYLPMKIVVQPLYGYESLNSNVVWFRFLLTYYKQSNKPPTQEFFIHMEKWPLSVKGCKIKACVRHSGPLSREGICQNVACCFQENKVCTVALLVFFFCRRHANQADWSNPTILSRGRVQGVEAVEGRGDWGEEHEDRPQGHRAVQTSALSWR
jgi:hypothetical protein